MNNLCRKVFQYSLISYLAISMYTRFVDGSNFDIFSRLFYSLPLEFLEGKNSVKFQTYCLTSNQVAELLKSDSKDQVHFEQDTAHSKYLIIRYKDEYGRHFGDLKVYSPYFQHPITLHINTTSSMDKPINLILPLSNQKKQRECPVNLHWKYFW